MKISDPMKSRPKEKQVMAQVRMPRVLYLEAAQAAKNAEMTLSGLVRGLLSAHVLENLLTARCLTPDCPRCAAANRKAT